MHCNQAVRSLLPTQVPLLAHCNRVAALGQALAHQLFLPTEQKSLLHDASLLHHDDTVRTRLLEDILAPNLLPTDLRGVLLAFASPGRGTPVERLLAEIIRLADAYDQGYESAPLEDRSVEDLFRGLREQASGGLWREEIVAAMENVATAQALGEPSQWKLPTFAPAAIQILSLLNNPDVNLRKLEEAAASDPATAGKIMQLANSALFHFRAPASTLQAAVTRLGFQTTRNVIAALMARPLLASRHVEPLWVHSLEVADLAEQLATQAGGLDPGEAYLCGLLHDVGSLVISRLPLFDSARLCGLEEGGCPPVYAETLLLRTDHAHIGSRLAAHWRLPPCIPEAIRDHHRPEKSLGRLAHILYLAEFLAGREEDLPSRFRLSVALEGAALPFQQVITLQASGIYQWLAAA